MAAVTCPDCGLGYDDTYRRTYCPHERFEMRTHAYAHGRHRLCTTVDELEAFNRGELPGDGDA